MKHSAAAGLVCGLIVLTAGLASPFVTVLVAWRRACYAFLCAGLITSVMMMSCEEYAIFKTKRELENFIDTAPIAETGEDFDRKEYLHEYEEETSAPVEETEPVTDDGNFRPMNFVNFSNQQ